MTATKLFCTSILGINAILMSGCATQSPYPPFAATSSLGFTPNMTMMQQPAPAQSSYDSNGTKKRPVAMKKATAEIGCKTCGYRY